MLWFLLFGIFQDYYDADGATSGFRGFPGSMNTANRFSHGSPAFDESILTPTFPDRNAGTNFSHLHHHRRSGMEQLGFRPVWVMND